VLATSGLAVASLSLSAWWGQAIAVHEVPVLTSTVVHSLESAVDAQLQAQAGSGGLPPPARKAAAAALDSPAVRNAIASGDPGPAVEAAVDKTDPALAPLLRTSPVTVPPVGRLVVEEGRRIRPLALWGAVGALGLCALALAVAAERFRVLRRVGRWGIVAGGTILVIGWVLPDAFGLARRHGTLGSIARSALVATVPLRALSETLVVAGLLLMAAGVVGGPLVRRRASASPRPRARRPGSPAGIGLPPSRARPRRAGPYRTVASSRVDVRL